MWKIFVSCLKREKRTEETDREAETEKEKEKERDSEGGRQTGRVGLKDISFRDAPTWLENYRTLLQSPCVQSQ